MGKVAYLTGRKIQPIVSTDGIGGKVPETITATPDSDRFLVANVADYDRGLSTLVITRDAQGKITGAQMNAIKMSQPDSKVIIDRLDIQRAVLVEHNGTEYAIVSDDNVHFLDTYWQAMYEAPNFLWTPSGPPIAYGGSVSAKKVAVGGKLGIVKDPFGTPQFLGATLPLDGYGIVNLGLSEDGKVLIGQLKGGFSGNIADWASTKPNQSYAWNVDALIEAALAVPEDKRLTKHLKLPDLAEQRVSASTGPVAGTFFDDDMVIVSQEGRMGDIIGVSLRELAARQLLVKENKATPAVFNQTDADTPWDKLSSTKQSTLSARMGKLSDFSIARTELDQLSNRNGDWKPALELIVQRNKDGSLIKDANGAPIPVSRVSENSAHLGSTVIDDFKNAGIVFFSPVITGEDEDKLRLGNTLTEKYAGLFFSYADAARPDTTGKAQEYKGYASVTAEDYASVPNLFFGDRPLDNPGYSRFELKGSVGSGSGNENDVLDVYRVEQRLKYLGFPAITANTSNATKDFAVDGKFKAEEKDALKLFEKIVRYTSITVTGKDSPSSPTVEVQYRAIVTAKIDTVTLEEVPGSLKIVSATGKATPAAIAAAREAAKKEALKASGFKNATTDVNGIDGKIEGPVGSKEDIDQRNTTLGWLNAYNAPHWMQYSQSFSETGKFTGWVNKQLGPIESTMGTSWVYDLMLASQNAAKEQGRGGAEQKLWFKGTGELGMQLNLGINTNYISEANQNKVNGKDVILGLVPSTYTSKQWDYGSATELAKLLLNPNLVNYNATTKTFGSNPNNVPGGKNRQDQAFLDFAAIFSATQNETGAAAKKNGSWEEQLNQIFSTTDVDKQKKIREALFGDGTQAGGLINSNNILLGGTALNLGAMLTADSLKKAMGNRNDVDYASWVEPLKAAMTEFKINTPQRIAAFLAQAGHETSGLSSMKEKPGPYQVGVILKDFKTAFTYNGKGTAQSRLRNPNQPPANATAAQIDEARYRNLQAFVRDELGLTVLENKKLDDVRGSVIGKGVWDEAMQRKFISRVYSEDISTGPVAANGKPGNGTEASQLPFNWIGRGLVHLTHAPTYYDFARYINTKHPELVTPTDGKTVAQTLMANPDLISANTPNGRALSALAGGWYWSTHSRMQTNADKLHFESSIPPGDQAIFNRISSAIGAADLDKRWDRYRLRIEPLAVTGGNPYESMREVLSKLGITTNNQTGYQKQFGVGLRVPTKLPVAIVEKPMLLASAADSDMVPLTSTGSQGGNMLALINETKADLGIQEGEYDMWLSDLPDASLPTTQIIIAAKDSVRQGNPANPKRIVGVCRATVGPEGGYKEENIYPAAAASDYMYRYEHRGNYFDVDGVIRLVQQPKHGELVLDDKVVPDAPDSYKYIPDKDFDGHDTIIFDVEKDGIKVQVRYRVEVASGGNSKSLCPGGREFWKISYSNPGDILSNSESAAQYWFTFGPALSAVTFADLPAGALGQTTGTTITLDTNAAGHNWFIDYTPYLNEEYLPTANPNVWQAKEGSDAAGKMDMLSVLLHEYGHTLGIEHSADQHASMASTLTPGTRRLPSADELALMAQLVGEVKTGLTNTPETPPTSPLPLGTALGGFWLARMRKSGPGEAPAPSSANTDPSATPHYAVAANPTLTNPAFTGGTGWSTSGTVTFDSGAATLTESATAQTRLNQLFVIGDTDRFLRFTLDNIALDDVNGAPDDAFEVALIDANTGLPLLGGTGLTRSDALLNLQADGTERIAPQVTRTLNPDDVQGDTSVAGAGRAGATGSRTYQVDLAGIAEGTVASLSFDLIGFGRNAAATSSHITVRGLSIGLGVPQAFDDTATTAEDAPVSIAALANDLDARQPGFAPVIVTGPTRGQVTVNADGTFGYTPNANDFGSDSFTYQLTDGRVASNLATVSITVTPVNDAPVATDTQVTTREDQTLVLDLLAQASDVDDVQGSTSAASAGSAGAATPSPVSGEGGGEGRLSTHIITGPAHGTLTANADGTYTYTPNANFNGADSFTYKVNDGELDSNLATVTLTVTAVNDAPQGTSTTVTTQEDTAYVFKATDFGFADLNDAASAAAANAFKAVVIDTVPALGRLTLNGLTVITGQSITVADILTGSLIFAPVSNANGNNYARFTFRVQDDGGTANGGLDSDPVSRTLTINVTAVNDAPVATDAQATTREDQARIFDLREHAADVDNAPASLAGQIIAAPTHGALTLNPDGTFTYTPNANFNGTDTFTYKVNDGALDSNVATVTVTVTPVNDAPQGTSTTVTTQEDTAYVFKATDFGFADLNDDVQGSTSAAGGTTPGAAAVSVTGANAFAAVFIDTLPQAGNLTLNGLTVTAGQRVTTADITAGRLLFTPAANANGPAYARFTFRVQDDGGTGNGGIDTALAAGTLTLNVTPVNDAPVAANGQVTGQEDTPYVFTWADFNITDMDSSSLSIIINSLPLDGLLQHSDGLTWLPVTVGQRITQADIGAGRLVFGPDANESGIDGYATTGTGNLKRDYARFTYQASDGQLLSGQATLTVDITPVADSPQLTLSAPSGASGATAQMFATGWESAPNRNTSATVLPQSELEGWRGVTPAGDTNNHFIVWSSGDKMKDATNANRTVYAAPGNGNNWIELGDTQGNGHETWGIERTVTTRAGARYDLNFDYAGRLGYSVDYTRIGLYVDGVKIGSYANTSPNTALNWQTVRLQFTGNGAAQTIRLVTEATASQSNGRGAMIDDLTLTEQQPLNTGYQDSPIRLSAIVAALQDTDGSETLGLTLGALPVGATLSDGTHSFTATVTATTADITTWSLGTLTITPPAGYTGSFILNITARATEAATNGTATQTVPLTVTVVPAHVTSPIVLDLNGDGIKTTALSQSQGAFDLLNTDTPIRSGWLSNEDGFLALDTNGNGLIDNRNELFGGDIGEGYAKLTALDSNTDGRIDAQDHAYAALKVWQDKNGNHQTDAGELHTLGDLDIRSLSLGYTIKPEQQHGNWLLEQSQATKADGTAIAMADAYFETARDASATGLLTAATRLKPEDENPRIAQITVQSKPAQPKAPGIPHGAFAVQGSTSVASAGEAPLLAAVQGPNKPLIQWAAQTTNGSADDDSTLTKNKKKPPRTPGWLDDFIGGKDAKHTDLAKATGLVVRIKEGGGA